MPRLARRAVLILALAVALPAAAADPALNLDAAGLALRGFDPVAYFRAGTPVRGRPDLAASHDGATYRFASAENRDAFLAAPARYLPQYGGFCAWAVAQGDKADGDPEVFRVVGDRLYLNYDRAIGRRWESDVPGNVAKADALWPKVQSKPR